MDSVIKLLRQTFTKNAYGVEIPTTAFREVFCNVGSITRSEFASAGRNGLDPAFVFSVFAGDYQGERTVEYQGETLAVYRTYRRPEDDYIEIYVERKGGTNGAQGPGG